MGRKAKLKKQRQTERQLQMKEGQLPSITPPPVGELVYSKDAWFSDNKPLSIDIVKSARTQRYLVCLDPNPSQEHTRQVTLTVWDSVERAIFGGEEAIKHLKAYTYEQLCVFRNFQEFISKLSDDDDQVIAVSHEGRVHTDRETRMAAMREFNKHAIESGDNIRFRVDGETVL
ncbi:hypothetical protein [Microcoleus sp. B9-D4]|uniref:hypothetical protein n=1 Tax=Microcoleus sp. B9-D4 TaxID=2818711 RepID=UPI002FCF2546